MSSGSSRPRRRGSAHSARRSQRTHTPASIDRLRRLVRCLDAAALRRAAFPDLAAAERALDAQGIRAQAELLLELAFAFAGGAFAPSVAATTPRVARELELARRDLRTVVAALEPFALAGRCSATATVPAAWPDPASLARTAYALAPRASVRVELVRRGWWDASSTGRS